MWSNRTPTAARYLFRMKTAYEERLFLRMWCGGKDIGWCLLTGWRTQNLGEMTNEDLEREGYGGKTLKMYFDTEFDGLSFDTRVTVVNFVMCPSVAG